MQQVIHLHRMPIQGRDMSSLARTGPFLLIKSQLLNESALIHHNWNSFETLHGLVYLFCPWTPWTPSLLVNIATSSLRLQWLCLKQSRAVPICTRVSFPRCSMLLEDLATFEPFLGCS